MLMYKYIVRFFKDISIYEDVISNAGHGERLLHSINVFLQNQSFEAAKDVYVSFFDSYWIGIQNKENPFVAIIESMRRYEASLGSIFSSQRDHYIHSANIFTLGIAIYSTSNVAKEKFVSFVSGTGYTDFYANLGEEFLYRWGVASLFHDVAYPLELLFKSLNSYLGDLFRYPCGDLNGNDVKAKIPQLSDFSTLEVILPLPQYSDEFYSRYPHLRFPKEDAHTLISEHLSKCLNLPLDKVSERVKNYENALVQNGIYDHAYYGALISLRWYHSLVKCTQWNPSYFYFAVLDSACAIFLHNAYKHLAIKELDAPFLEYEKMPISFLLILCDELQDWNRLLYGDSTRVLPDKFTFEVKECETIFRYHFDILKTIPPNYAEKKKRDLESVLSLNSLFPEIKLEVSHGN